MKLGTLLASAAVLAMAASAASAQTTTVRTGQFTNGVNTGHVTVNDTLSLDKIEPIANGTATQVGVTSAWYSATTSTANVGGAGSTSDGAPFSLVGTVSTDCAFYSGDRSTLSFDFGQIGINTSDDVGPNAAFTMVAPATMSFDTNLAGCNTANTVSISKNDIRGLVNNAGSGYDSAVFQANLPYSVTASYTAPATNTVAVGTLQSLTVAADRNAAQSAQHGAWKSNMDIQVVVPQATQALLAGQYSGNFTVTVAAL